METKICGKCKEIKSITLFGINKNTKSGYRSTCNDCRKIESREYRDKNPEKRKNTIKKYYENNKEIISEKSKTKSTLDIKNVRLIKLKSYHKNKDKNKEKLKLYRIKNRQHRTEYQKFKINNDPLYKLSSLIRSRITFILKKNNFSKKNKTIDIVGCTPQELKTHLERQFQDGMSWDNYGFYGWHIDHIIPLSSAQNEEEIYKLCHYTNLQPLWAKDNLSKGDKLL